MFPGIPSTPVQPGQKHHIDPPEQPTKKCPRYETTTTVTTEHTTKCTKEENGTDPKETDRLRRLHSVNRSVISMFEGALHRDPGADLSNLLESYTQVYSNLRKKAEERALKSLVVHPPRQSQSIAPQGKTVTPTRRIKAHQKIPREAKKMLQVPPGTPRIIRPLAPSVIALFTSSHDSNPLTETKAKSPSDSDSTGVVEPKEKEGVFSVSSEQLARVLAGGELLWQFSKKVVVKLTETIGVKLGIDMDLDQADAMLFVLQQTKNIPIPEPLGVISVSNTTYLFMSYIPGTCLSQVWSSMTADQKSSVRSCLDGMIQELRSIPQPSQSYELGFNKCCKDARTYPRHIRKSGPITTEVEFNKFLLSNPRHRIAKPYLAMMSSRLRNDHEIVFTHGGLDPDNILVDGDYNIVGLVGWETSGWYPEYWEYLKALNNFSTTAQEGDDWWDYLPVCVGDYRAEWALDRLINTIIEVP